MKIKFKYTTEEKTPRTIISETVKGEINSLTYVEKFYEVNDVVQSTIIFNIGNRTFDLNNMKNVILFKMVNGEYKSYVLEKSDITGLYKLNGVTYNSLEELFYEIDDFT